MLTLLDAIDTFREVARPLFVYFCVCVVLIPTLLGGRARWAWLVENRRDRRPTTF